VALAALQGGKTLGEQFDVHPNQSTDWKRQLLKNAEDVFLTKAERRAGLPPSSGLDVTHGRAASGSPCREKLKKLLCAEGFEVAG